MIGQIISHYKILAKLGQGGMGVVYKAQDLKLDRFVALKFLPQALVANKSEKMRFVHEAKAASALDHPNICTIHEINETDDGQMFIVMAYYEGETLQKRVAKGEERGKKGDGRKAKSEERDAPFAPHSSPIGITSGLPVVDAIEIAIQIAQGLAKAHAHGIVHRDLKPANVMFTKDGMVKIVDFGLALLADQPRLTKTGSTVGTMAYMSPEQARGEQVDQRTDIWALGVVLYEMLTGQLPFKGEYEHAILFAILKKDPQSITDFRSDVPMGLEQIVEKALMNNSGKRYQQMNEMLLDLKSTARIPGSRSVWTIKARLPKRMRVFLYGGIVTFLILLISLLAIWGSFGDRFSKPNPVSSAKSIAVLPFTDMSAEKDQEYFCDGITEELINALAQIPELKVPARTSAFQFKGRESDIQTIGEKLKVGTILEGSVRKSGSKVRVTAQLINVADGFHLWSHTFERELADVFAIQDDLSRAIVEVLQVKLSSEQDQRITRRPPKSIEAYNLYLKGRYFWNKRTEEGLKKSIDCFQQAFDLDSTFALAYAGLADAYNILGSWMYVEPKEAFPKAKAAAQKALEIDEGLAEAHAALAHNKYEYDWDWQGAESEYKKALALNPNYAGAHYGYAKFLGHLGRYDEAHTEFEKALELDPLSLAIHASSAGLYRDAGQDDQAIEQAKRVLEMDSNNTTAHIVLFDSYFRKGWNDDAFKHFMIFYSIFYDFTSAEKETIQRLHNESGWDGVARFMITFLEAKSKEKYVPPMDMIVFYLMLKDHERTLDCLEKAYQMRDPFINDIGHGDVYEALQAEPRFQALLKKVGLEK